MCGRDYSTFTDEELEMRYLNRNPIWKWPTQKTTLAIRPNFNMCPTQKAPVLNVLEGQIGLHEMRWGLVPAWAKTVKDADKYSMINAKAEEITEKRSYKAAFQARRCIVPVSGFYEWRREGDKKRPFAIHMNAGGIVSLAGIWEHWVNQETGEIVDSFALITTMANAFMQKIHDRMPVILDEKDEEIWLDPEITDPKKVVPLLKPCPSELLAAEEISTLVNSPKNNSADVLKKI
jgi:putative SOS response-associated peptidase YedK